MTTIMHAGDGYVLIYAGMLLAIVLTIWLISPIHRHKRWKRNQSKKLKRAPAWHRSLARLHHRYKRRKKK